MPWISIKRKILGKITTENRFWVLFSSYFPFGSVLSYTLQMSLHYDWNVVCCFWLDNLLTSLLYSSPCAFQHRIPIWIDVEFSILDVTVSTDHDAYELASMIVSNTTEPVPRMLIPGVECNLQRTNSIKSRIFRLDLAFRITL